MHMSIGIHIGKNECCKRFIELFGYASLGPRGSECDRLDQLQF